MFLPPPLLPQGAGLPFLENLQLTRLILPVIMDYPALWITVVHRPWALLRAARLTSTVPDSPPHALGSEACRRSHPRSHAAEVLLRHETVCEVPRAPEDR